MPQLHIKQFSHSEQKTQPVEHIVKTEKRTHAEWFKCYSYLGSKTSLFLWGMWKADICWELNPGFLVWAIVHYYWAMTARQQPATILCTKCLSHTSSSHACMHVLIVLTTDQMVTLVAYKLERRSLWEVCFGMSIRQPRKQLTSSSYNHNTLTTIRTSAESLQMHFKVALRNFALDASRWFPHRCSEGCQLWLWGQLGSCLTGCLMQLASMNLS